MIVDYKAQPMDNEINNKLKPSAILRIFTAHLGKLGFRQRSMPNENDVRNYVYRIESVGSGSKSGFPDARLVLGVNQFSRGMGGTLLVIEALSPARKDWVGEKLREKS